MTGSFTGAPAFFFRFSLQISYSKVYAMMVGVHAIPFSAICFAWSTVIKVACSMVSNPASIHICIPGLVPACTPHLIPLLWHSSTAASSSSWVNSGIWALCVVNTFTHSAPSRTWRRISLRTSHGPSTSTTSSQACPPVIQIPVSVWVILGTLIKPFSAANFSVLHTPAAEDISLTDVIPLSKAACACCKAYNWISFGS